MHIWYNKIRQNKGRDKMKKFLIKILGEIRDKEAEKPVEKMNADLVIRCSRLILKLRGINSTLSEEEVRKRVEKIFKSQ